MSTKLITVLFNDEQSAITRWHAKGWQPITRTYVTEPDPKDPNKSITVANITLAKIGTKHSTPPSH